MPIQNIITDYSGRKKDVNIMPFSNPRSSDVQKVLPSFGKVSSYCAGLQKLIQRYMITLLTVKGSQPYDPEFGTDFFKNLIGSNTSTSQELATTFNFANYEVISLFRNYQAKNPGLPVDEQLDTAVLDSVDMNGTNIQFNVKLYTLAGENVDFVMPVPYNY